MGQPAPIPRRSRHLGSAACSGRSDHGSHASTSAASSRSNRRQGNHNQFQTLKMFPDGHLLFKLSHDAINDSLGALVHFINCHGATLSPGFYGEDNLGEIVQYPIAMASDKSANHIRPGAIAAAECCYGAQTYNAELAGVSQPICLTYLEKGALG